MTRHCKSLIYPLLEEIFISNHSDVTDDNYADLLEASWQESIQELIDYLEELKKDYENN